MNVRWIKEIRELLPWLGGTLGLMVVPYAVWGHEAEGLLVVVFAFGSVLMAVSSFGSELQHRTVGLLLSQPVPRAVIWREKMGALALGLTVSLGVAWACLSLVGRSIPPAQHAAYAGILMLVALCAFCATPYFTLAMRLPAGAVVCSLAFPMMLLGAGDDICRHWLRMAPPEWMAIPVLLVYGAILYRLGYRTFQRLEVLELSSPGLEPPAWLETLFQRARRDTVLRTAQPFRSLLQKELGLQQPTLLVVGVCFLGAVIAGMIHWVSLASGEALLGGCCGLGIALVPLLAGALAVAEENALGIADWHKTLPPSARQQWLAKMLVTLGVGMAASLALGTSLFLGLRWFHEGGDHPALPSAAAVGYFVLAVLLSTSLAAYAGTFCRNTLKAILLALGLAVGGAAGSVFGTRLGLTWWRGLEEVRLRQPSELGAGLSLVLALLAVTALLQWLAFANDHRGVWSLPRKALQIILLLAVVGVLSVAVVMQLVGG